jgi:Fe-S-cluster containining protein
MIQDSSFDNYTQLLEKVEQLFAETRARHPGEFRCGAGCFGCCKAGLSVANVEAARIRSWLHDRPEIQERRKSPGGTLGDSEYCRFLNAAGQCVIYEVRPLICRSHGMPISWNQEGTEARDCCPLNFEGIELGQLMASDVLSLDKVNTLLSLVDRNFDPENSGKRVPLADIGESP